MFETDLQSDKDKIVYLAGLIDGEGCIAISKSKPRGENKSTIYNLSLTVNMVHKPTIDFIQRTLGGSVVRRKSHSKNGRYFHSWTLSCSSAADVIKLLQPYLIAKRKQADLALKFQDRVHAHGRGGYLLSQRELAQRDKLYWQMRELKREEW